MSKLAEIWKIAAADLGLEVVAPFQLVLPDHTRIEFDALVKKFGFENGMLLTEEYSKIEGREDAIVGMGYGFSVLWRYPSDSIYERLTYIELLSDWTWSGPIADRPDWLLDQPNDDEDSN